MNGVGKDLIFGLRQLARSPSTSLVMVLTLALGIGATTAVFSVVNGVLLRDLPIREPGRVALITKDNPENGIEDWPLSYPNYRDLRDTSRQLASLAAYSSISANVATDAGSVRVEGALVSSGFLRVLGLEPQLGREFTPEEDQPGGPDVAIISHELWQQELGQDPEGLGSVVLVDGRPRTVVGVLPPNQSFLDEVLQLDPNRIPKPVDVLMPVAPVGHDQRRETSAFGVIARLRPDADFGAADAEFRAFLNRIQQEHPPLCCGWVGKVRPLQAAIVGKVRPALLLAMAVVGVVLVLVCVNLSALLTVRSTSRAREWAVRKALGAGQTRIVRQLLTESLILGSLGGGAGLLLGLGLLRVLIGLTPPDLPRLDEVGLDPVVVGFALCVSFLAALLFGVAPAIVGSRRAPGDVLRVRQLGLSARGSRSLRALVAFEVALALVLLTLSGVLTASFRNIAGQDPGYRAAGLLTAGVKLSRTEYPGDQEVRRFLEELAPRLRALPGTEAAGLTSFPMPRGPRILFEIEGRVDAEGRVATAFGRQMAVTPGTFDALGMEVLSGRSFTRADDVDGRPVVIVSEVLAEEVWPGEEPVGQRIRVGSWRDFEAGAGATPAREREVVGVVSDIRRTGVEGVEPIPYLYQPLAQDPWHSVYFWLRATSGEQAQAPALREAVAAVDPQLPLFDVEPVSRALGRHRSRERFLALLVSVFAAIALVLAAVGIYGVAAYSTAARTREIGLRMAMGAAPGRLVRRLLVSGMVPASAGAVFGAGATVLLARALASFLYGVQASDPLVLSLTALALGAVALIATWLPARKAARIDPTMALQEE